MRLRPSAGLQLYGLQTSATGLQRRNEASPERGIATATYQAAAAQKQESE